MTHSRWGWTGRWHRDEYRHGDFNRICDRTGFKVKASETRHEWNGLIVRKESWEPRHPQDFVKARGDRQRVPYPRPEPTSDTFINAEDVTPDDL